MLRGLFTIESLHHTRWLRHNAGHVRIAGCFLLELAAAVFVDLEGQGDLIWLANGVLLSYLLLAPRWRWRAYFAAGFAAQVMARLLAGVHSFPMVLAISGLNVAEAGLAAFLLRSRSARLPRFTELRYLLRFFAFAVCAAPALAAIGYAAIVHREMRLGFWSQFLGWFTSDALGMAVASPALVAVFTTRFREIDIMRRRWIYPVTLAVVTISAFSQDRALLIFVINPLLVLIQLRLRIGWAALGTLFVAAAGSWYTAHGHGPFIVAGAPGVLNGTMRLQLLVSSAMFMVYAISVVMENLRATEARLRDVVYLHDLVTENSRDIIILADLKGNRSYVSKASQTVSGWDPQELVKAGSYAHIHPDDVGRAQEAVRKLRQGADYGMIECRASNRRGEYVWVEASLRLIRDPRSGAPKGILNIVRDITERKHAEQSREFHQSLLTAIHEVSLDGILVVNEQGDAVSYNNRFAEVWRIPASDCPAGSIVRLSDQRLLAQCAGLTREPEAFLNRIRELYADSEANDQCQFELNDGRTLERYSTSLRTESGTCLGRVWFFRDITARIRAEQQLKAAYQAVERLAVMDSLTGIANRRRFDEYLAIEWRRALRESQPLSLVLFDVDLFKLYNDTYGHLRGDDCLRQIAESAMDVITRPGDLVARFGGEEFAVILPNTGRDGAWLIARDICAALRHRRLPHRASEPGIVTISAGCATMVPQLGRRASDLIEFADRALYQAKRRGRDRVCSSRDRGTEAGNKNLLPAETAISISAKR